MENGKFYFERHLKLWEEQNRLVKRLIVVTIVFAFVLTLRVLEPFSIKLVEQKDVQAQITALAPAIEKSRALQASLARFEQALSVVKENVRQSPWFREKDKLIHKLAAIRRTAPLGGTREQFQAAADETIHTIGDLIVNDVIEPLEKALPAAELQTQAFVDLAQNLSALRDDIAQWEKEHINKNWYRTYHEKDETMADLTQSLHAKTNRLIELHAQTLDQLKAEQRTNQARIKASEAKEADYKKEKERLKQEMQDVLPKWLHGVLDVDHMVILFPLILIGMAGVIVGLAIILTRHYEVVAHYVGLSAEVRKDTALSSLWTLTSRGPVGTVLTLVTYISVLLIFWGFFERGFDLFIQWIGVEHAPIIENWNPAVQGLLWGGRLVLGAMIVVVVLSVFGYAQRLWGRNR